MKIAFVGIVKDWEQLKKNSYIESFIKYHLELPWYYAEYGNNHVTVVATNNLNFEFNTSRVRLIHQDTFLKEDTHYDVVVHWRKWFDELYKEDSINVINSQDHSFGEEWHIKVQNALSGKKLYGITCFPGWHENQISNEVKEFHKGQIFLEPKMLPGMTLGVDTEIYKPTNKNPFQLLWASDPGRGVEGAIKLAIELFQKNKSFRLHVCWPDYYKGNVPVKHPAIVNHNNLLNGQELWDLFNMTSYVPYTATFREPSSRVHRQAMAAGALILYPPNMGTPSELITKDVGVVADIGQWKDIILHYVNNKTAYDTITKNAVQLAYNERWEVQAKRFTDYFNGVINGKY